jgi:hypothetical protein
MLNLPKQDLCRPLHSNEVAAAPTRAWAVVPSARCYLENMLRQITFSAHTGLMHRNKQNGERCLSVLVDVI